MSESLVKIGKTKLAVFIQTCYQITLSGTIGRKYKDLFKNWVILSDLQHLELIEEAAKFCLNFGLF